MAKEMREGQPSLKGFFDLGLKLESCWVTHRQEDVDISRPSHKQSNVSLTGRLTNHATAFLIPPFFDTFLRFYMFTLKYQKTKSIIGLTA